MIDTFPLILIITGANLGFIALGMFYQHYLEGLETTRARTLASALLAENAVLKTELELRDEQVALRGRL